MLKFIFHIINGIRSNIPLCCTYEYSMRSFKGEQEIAYNTMKRRGKIIREDDDGRIWVSDDSAEYVQCDKCYKHNRKNELKQNGIIWYQLWPPKIIKWD